MTQQVKNLINSLIKQVNQTRNPTHSQLNEIITLAKTHNLTQSLYLSKELPQQKLNFLLFSVSKAKNEIEFTHQSFNNKTYIIAKVPVLPSVFIIQSLSALINSCFTLHQLDQFPIYHFYQCPSNHLSKGGAYD